MQKTACDKMAAVLDCKRRVVVFFTLLHGVIANNVTVTYEEEIESRLSWDDATWILASAFIIFTMQSGEYSNIHLNRMCK